MPGLLSQFRRECRHSCADKTLCGHECCKTGVRAELLDRNDRWDNTALHIASIRGNLDIVTALIEAGAQIDNKNEDEQTPLHVAAKHGKLK